MARPAALLVAGVLCCGAAVLISVNIAPPEFSHALQTVHSSTKSSELKTQVLHEIVVRRPAGPPLVELTTSDPQGRSSRVACGTCHSVRSPNLENRSSEALDEFHQGLQFRHGSLACYACHNPDDADSLRLADGTWVAYADVLTLCSQCHSQQAESFAHGAHGGMNGFWDLTRGSQTKNNCIDCHDPHAPRYPHMKVGFKPRDRFLDEGESSHDQHE